MGKKSTKENKTKYHLLREELGWSREYASEQLGIGNILIEKTL